MLSVVIVAWNEEENLPRVVASVQKLADEIVVVVDEASTDKTLAVAKKLKCKVFTHPHTGIVEPMRNFAIAKASQPWILLLDADEEVPTDLAQLIVQEMKNPKADYYRLTRKNIIFGKWIKSGHWWPDYVYRLFRKGNVTWADTVHSLPTASGIGKDLPADEAASIVHHHYTSIHQYLTRMDRYTDFQAKSKLDTGYNFAWIDLVIKPIDEFFNQYFSRKGYGQGIHGLSLAMLQMFSESLLYLKLWEANKFVQLSPKVSELNKLLTVKAKEFVWWNYQHKIDTSPWPIKYYWKLKRKFNA